MEAPTGILSPRVEQILQSPEITIEANSYKTRGRPIELSINGEKTEWHSVKGGVTYASDQNNKAIHSASYEILFSPATKEWLKIVPPEALLLKKSDVFTQRLKVSAEIGRTALIVAGLPQLAAQFRDVSIKIKGEEVYGFISPHIGPSLEYLLYKASGQKKPKTPPNDTKKFFEIMYDEAYHQAEFLYLKHNMWMSDPNPGNILLHVEPNDIRVVLIDFSTSEQVKDSQFSHIRKDQLSPEAHAAIVARERAKSIRKLQETFRSACNNLQISFNPSSPSAHTV